VRASIRGGGAGGGAGMEYATGWSMATYELPAIAVPGWVGFGGATYWGGMPFTDYPNAFTGMVAVLLALPAVFATGWRRWFAVALAGVALVIAFGRYFPVYGFLYEHLPLFNKFRVPVMIVLLFHWRRVAWHTVERGKEQRHGADARAPGPLIPAAHWAVLVVVLAGPGARETCRSRTPTPERCSRLTSGLAYRGFDSAALAFCSASAWGRVAGAAAGLASVRCWRCY
jgi:hypothetical protein